MTEKTYSGVSGKAKNSAHIMPKKQPAPSLLPGKFRIDIQPDRRDWVLRHGLWDIGIFNDYTAATAAAIRMAQREEGARAAEIFIHNRVGERFLIWQTRMRKPSAIRRSP